jgi:hypothetical protein
VELAVSSECEPVVRSIRSADILYVGVFSGCDRDLVEAAVVPVEAVKVSIRTKCEGPGSEASLDAGEREEVRESACRCELENVM